jgi:glycosyltransferase involved in cell wall biosynthesis
MKNNESQSHTRQAPRILLLSNMYPTDESPSYGIFVKNIYTQLESAGIDIKKCVIEGQSRTKLGKLLDYAFYVVKAIFIIMFTRRIVYIHFIAHTSIPVVIMSIFRRFNIVAHIHGGDVMAQPNVNKKWASMKSIVAKRTLMLSKRVIVPSQYFSDFVQTTFSVDPNSIFVSPSGGVDTQRFQPVERQPQKVIKLGYVGRLDSGKGVDILLKAMRVLMEQGVHIQLTVVGAGKEQEKLVQYAIDNNLSEACRFIGVLTQSELVAYYQTFDYFVFPTELNESLGLVGLEAMSCGVPVITSGHAGIGDYFENRVNGFKFEFGSYISLCDVLSNLPLVSSTIYRQMAEQCRLTALKFDSEVVKEKLVKELSMLSFER